MVIRIAAEELRRLSVRHEEDARELSPEIAARSQSPEIPQRAPADRLIAATAMVGDADLLSADEAMRKVAGLRVVW